ncbi:MAG: CapA family protein [Cyanobacteriota bacterium]|nr:CapA family protein [Cyanobacteriota bacterium]
MNVRFQPFYRWTQRAILSVGFFVGAMTFSQLARSQEIAAEKHHSPPMPGQLSKVPPGNSSSGNLPPVPLDVEAAGEFLDIRGVGDAALAVSHQQPFRLTDALPLDMYPEGLPANFGALLDRFDPTGLTYRGDFTYINWETAVGNECSEFWASPAPGVFAFVSHPANLVEAYERGFNLIGLANNHTRDCIVGENMDGTLMSVRHMEQLGGKQSLSWLWHGIGERDAATVQTLTVKGREVKVAFASLYVGGGDCSYITCVSDTEIVLRSLADADADIRILALHSWDESTQQELVSIGTRFIRDFDGDIVFGHGPHTWEPVRLVRSNSGKQGVLFESLGDFIHPNLGGGADNFIGRVLFDLETLEVRQVQAIPIFVDGAIVTFNGAANPLQVPSAEGWQLVDDASWRGAVSPNARGAYFNVP